MRLRVLISILAMLLIGGGSLLRASERDYGLHINAYPTEGELFSGFALEGGRPIPLNGKTLQLSFDLYNRPENVFGCIFRILTDKGENVDLMYTSDQNDVRQPILVTGADVHPLDCPIPLHEWIHVSLTLNPKDGQLDLDFNGTAFRMRDAGTKGAKSFRIAFGMCPFAGYTLTDVASVNLKDIRVDRGGNPLRHWKLARHVGETCYDEIAGVPVSVKNPVWLIDRYASFRPIFSYQSGSIPSVTFDGDATFYLASPGGPLHVFHADGREPEEIEVRGGISPANYPNQLFFESGDRSRLTAYNLDEGLFSVFDFDALRWDNAVQPTRDHNYWNNTNAWDPRLRALFSFGGYGHYHYRNELIVSYFDAPERNARLTVEAITPRYASTSCVVDSVLYVFGGRGNPSGKQELSPKNYYDLYAFDTRTLAVRKLWDMETSPYGDFVSGENFVVNRENGDFYLLSNLEGFTLLKLRPDAPGTEKMSLPIQPKRNAQYNYFNIWYSPGQGKMYAVVLQSQVDDRTDADVYEIDYPPIPVSEILQDVRPEKPRRLPQGFWWKAGLALAFLLLAVGNALLLLHLRRRRHAPVRPVLPADEEEDRVPYYDFSRSSINFFGGFQVTDRSGNDITAQFTPTLKALLILLILYTERSGGIASKKINSLLWSYKMDDTANNNRNVYMSKLRVLLEEVGDVRILNANKLWSIEFGPSCLCDYMEASRLFKEGSGEEDLDRLLELYLRGPILPNTELDWIDDFKSAFSLSATDFLSRQLPRTDLSDRTLLKAADTILQHDFLNEEALWAKIRLLVRHSKPGLAKTIYDNFCKEYRKSLGIEYGVPFKELIN